MVHPRPIRTLWTVGVSRLRTTESRRGAAWRPTRCRRRRRPPRGGSPTPTRARRAKAARRAARGRPTAKYELPSSTMPRVQALDVPRRLHELDPVHVRALAAPGGEPRQNTDRRFAAAYRIASSAALLHTQPPPPPAATRGAPSGGGGGGDDDPAAAAAGSSTWVTSPPPPPGGLLSSLVRTRAPFVPLRTRSASRPRRRSPRARAIAESRNPASLRRSRRRRRSSSGGTGAPCRPP